MEEDCKYNPVCDLCPVDQVGLIDLAAAFVNHSIPENVQATEQDFNNIDDPSQILGVPHDFAEAALYRATIHDHKKKDE